MTAGLTTLTSSRPPGEVVDALVRAIETRGMTVFARFDHAAAAREAGLRLRPTDVVVFGSPRAGTPLMDAVPTAALDLPLKVLVWQGEDGLTRLTSDDPAAVIGRHGLPELLAPTIEAMRSAIASVSREAAGST